MMAYPHRFSGFILPVTMIVVAALTRLLPHAPNFTPIGAIALFAGAHLDKKWRFVVPLGTMFLSDLFLGFHGTMPYVYGSFILSIFMGIYLQDKKSVAMIGLSSLLASVLFFLITNFGVWASSKMYTKDLSGLIDAYTLGLPFFRNTLVSDLLFTAVLFYGYFFIASYKPTLPVSQSSHGR